MPRSGKCRAWRLQNLIGGWWGWDVQDWDGGWLATGGGRRARAARAKSLDFILRTAGNSLSPPTPSDLSWGKITVAAAA